MRIYAPVKNANGRYASVMFVDGVGYTDNPMLIDWFINHGYEVEEETKETPVDAETDLTQVLENPPAEQPDFEAMTPNELREWMKANGYGSQIKNIRDKEKLLNIIKG